MNHPASFFLRSMSPIPTRVYPGEQGRTSFRLAISTKSLAERPVVRQLRRAGTQAAGWIGRVARESGFAERWRLILLLVVLSYVTAGLGTRALMASLEDTWTEVALVSVRHENQELRLRQEILREQTEEALARLATLETTEASFARTP